MDQGRKVQAHEPSEAPQHRPWKVISLNRSIHGVVIWFFGQEPIPVLVNKSHLHSIRLAARPRQQQKPSPMEGLVLRGASRIPIVPPTTKGLLGLNTMPAACSRPLQVRTLNPKPGGGKGNDGPSSRRRPSGILGCGDKSHHRQQLQQKRFASG